MNWSDVRKRKIKIGPILIGFEKNRTSTGPNPVWSSPIYRFTDFFNPYQPSHRKDNIIDKIKLRKKTFQNGCQELSPQKGKATKEHINIYKISCLICYKGIMVLITKRSDSISN